MRPELALEYQVPEKGSIPALNRVFLVRAQNDLGGDGRGPYLPKALFDEAQLALEYVVSKLKWPADKDLPKPDAKGGYHFDGYSIEVMPVLSREIMERQGDVADELNRVREELAELQLYEAALAGANIG